MKTFKPVKARFWSKVEKSDGCWLWGGALDRHGYGRFWDSDRGKTVRAHRYSYELVNDPIPDGLEIDHLCRVRNCVRPDHLEAVTDYENRMRGESPHAQNRRKTHCHKGHEFTPENTRIQAVTGSRMCRTCVRERKRLYRISKKGDQ